ncbi:hypothetical protein ABH905_004996 [Pseudomonas frederiksbergensis]
MPSDYSLSDVLERLFENQQALEAAIMELTLLIEEQGARKWAEMSVVHCGPWVKTPVISNKAWLVWRNWTSARCNTFAKAA